MPDDTKDHDATENSRSGKSLWGFLQVLSPFYRPYRFWLACILAAMAMQIAFEICLPLSLKYLIDEAIVPRNTERLVLILSLLAAAALVTTISLLGMDYAYAVLETGVLGDIRVRLFNHLQGLSMGFFSRWPVGDIMSRFGTDLASVEQAVTASLPCALYSSTGLLFGVALLFRIEWRLASIMVIWMTVSFFLARLLETRAARSNYAAKQEEGRVSALVQENLGAQAVIKGFGLQEIVRDRFVAQIGVLRRVKLRASLFNYVMQRIPQASSLTGGFVVVGIGAYLAYRGEMSVGDLVAFNGLLFGVTGHVGSLTWAVPLVLQATAGIARIEDILREQPRVQDPPDGLTLEGDRHDVRFRQVTFSYDGTTPSLRGVDLTIHKGQHVALVGPSGSGKSTVLNLLLRLYDPDSGEVSLGDVDLRRVRQDCLRRRIGVVFQESLLFNTTIRENIRMGKLDASLEEIERAATSAGVTDFADRLPDRLETVVGERGNRLSGGQRQRIGIARAILRDPGILALDEATSALDPATETAINATLRRVGQNRTVVSVTHRLASVVRADTIFVFDRGELTEAGRHEELLQKNGVYARLWEKQSGLALSADGESAAVSGDRLRDIPVLARLSQELLSEAAGMFVTESCPESREVVREGDAGDKFYIVVRGRLAVLKNMPSGETRQQAVMEIGDHFGEISLLSNVPRTATLRTITPCIFLTLGRSQFLGLLAKAPAVRADVESAMANRLERDRSAADGPAEPGRGNPSGERPEV